MVEVLLFIFRSLMTLVVAGDDPQTSLSVWGSRQLAHVTGSVSCCCVRRAMFVSCAPPEGCQGGYNSSCARSYSGDRCSECAAGSYRFSGLCKPCPNTAWLMFLLATVVILLLVVVSVYLGRRRLNLAVLGIGMVRACLKLKVHS